jgi:hypothetical protein
LAPGEPIGAAAKFVSHEGSAERQTEQTRQGGQDDDVTLA